MKKCNNCKEYKSDFDRGSNGRYLATCNKCRSKDLKCKSCNEFKPRNTVHLRICKDCRDLNRRNFKKCNCCKERKDSKKEFTLSTTICNDCTQRVKYNKCKRCKEQKLATEVTEQVCNYCRANPKKRGPKEKPTTEKKLKVDKVKPEPLTPKELLERVKEKESQKSLIKKPILRGYIYYAK